MFKPLRDKILELAITGKLVPQLESEPAVEQIGPAPAQDEVPFELPNNWKLVYLSEIATLINGRAYSKNELLEKREGLTPIVRVGNFFTNSKYFYSDLKLDEKNYCEKGDLLFAWSASFGPKLWDGPRSIFHYHIWKVLCSQHVDKLWLFYWFWAKTQELKDASHGTTMVHITKAFMESNVVALPPLEEQRRIVSKLDDIMGNLERMDQAYTELSGPMAKHFKNLVLQQAISGQLVPQLDSEPAVEQIGLAPAKEEEPFALPEKWKWVRLDQVAQYRPSVKADDELEVSFAPLEKLSDGYDNFFCFDLIERWSKVKKGFSRFCNGDVIFAKIHPSFQNRKSAVVTRAHNGIGCGSTEYCVFRCKEPLDNQYLLWFFKSEYFISFGKNTFKGTVGQQRVNLDVITTMLFPLPPLEEQRRIVARIEELFGDVDKLLEWQQFA